MHLSRTIATDSYTQHFPMAREKTAPLIVDQNAIRLKAKL
jgi:hypothetical protein